MANTFTVTIPPGTVVADALKQVREGIVAKGGTFAFDGKVGSFRVSGVEGLFSLAGSQVTITINKKPFVVSHGLVEGKIREFFV